MKIARWTIASEQWKGRPDTQIALLADPHVIWPWMTPARLAEIVEAINQLAPDVVLLLGDYVGTHLIGRQIEPAAGIAPFKKLSARYGVYAVIGNHDISGPGNWPAALKDTGIPVLENRALFIDHGRFWIAGLEDKRWQQPDVGKALGDVKDDNPVILMMHSPDSFPEVPESVVLTVAGHTHGGQIRFPFLGAVPLVVPSAFGSRYAYGHIIEGGRHLVVSGGIGTSGIPVRFLMPPEIVMVTLTAAPSRLREPSGKQKYAARHGTS
ncbi:MAG TPA: metallophosphoesterase [Patescibacteria group bacterium]|nr:metallophosphoesterase [Patescibacteria group bacterium]